MPSWALDTAFICLHTAIVNGALVALLADERALQLLHKLGDDRCKDEEKWREVALALAAVDMARGVYKREPYRGFPLDRNPAHNISADEARRTKTLEEQFYRWCRRPMDGKEFMDVEIPPEQAELFTAAAQNMMSEYAEDALRRKDAFVQSSLKYTAPKVNQKAHDKRNLYNPDTARYNKIFNRMCREAYRGAQREALKRLDDTTAKRKKSELAIAEEKCLYRMGLASLARWVEEDETEKEDVARRKREDAKSGGDMAHRGFVRKKNRMRVRLPDEMHAQDGKRRNKSAPRMDFTCSRSGVVRRKQDNAPPSSAHMAAVYGVGSKKYVHAHGKRDLELSRKHLHEQGYVFKSNFVDEDGDPIEGFADERRRAERERKERSEGTVRKRSTGAKEKYREWLEVKTLMQKAKKMLGYIDHPMEAKQNSRAAYWLNVGKLCKSVDASLLGDWVAWSRGYMSAGECHIKWDQFDPIACDTCSATSMVHNTLLKILNRPGLNFESAFKRAAVRALKKQMASDGRDLDEATETERRDAFEGLELTPRQFDRCMRDLGIVLNSHQTRILFTLFDSNGDGTLSKAEFLQFTGPERPESRGEALYLLRDGRYCLWEQCCHVTGMKNGYDIVPSDEPPEDDSEDDENWIPLRLRNGKRKKGWWRAPLPDLRARVERMIRKGTANWDDVNADPPTPCHASRWTLEDRASALSELRTMSRQNMRTERQRKTEMEGDAPSAPVLSCVPMSRYGNDHRETKLRLKWGPGKASAPVTFYVLETCGKEGSSAQRKHEYEEVYRDPPSAASASGSKCEVKVESLRPNTRYYYRIRAFNGHGASPYAYASFATAPSVPNCPVVVSKGDSSITLEWSASQETALARKEMRALFSKLAESRSRGRVDGSVESITLIDWLDAVDRDPALTTLLRSLKSSKRTPEHESVYDCIEHLHDAEMLTWNHLENHLEDESRSRTSRRSRTHSVASDQHYVLSVCVSDEEIAPIKGRGKEVCLGALKSSNWFLNQHAAPALSGSRSVRVSSSSKPSLPNVYFVEAPDVNSVTEKPSLRVVLKKGRTSTKSGSKRRGYEAPGSIENAVGNFSCDVTHLEVYEPVYIGSDTSFTFTGCEPGKSYQFRVQAFNTVFAEAEARTMSSDATVKSFSRLSEPCVVHASHSAKVSLRASSVRSTSVSFTWKEVNVKSKVPHKTDWTEVVNAWAQANADFGSVNSATVRKVFMKYDEDCSGNLDASEIRKLLRDLGITPGSLTYERALATLDAGGRGRIDLATFSSWWRDENAPIEYIITRTRSKGAGNSSLLPGASINASSIVFRGESARRATVQGLKPNTSYSFQLYYLTNKAISFGGAEKSITTAPESPQRPVLIEVESNSVRLKWYPGVGGAASFVLEQQVVEGGDRGSSRWTSVYEGASSCYRVDDLKASVGYRFRVCSANSDGTMSDPSLPTPPIIVEGKRRGRAVRGVKSVSEFNVECTGDVTPGDTILFTERIFESLDSTRRPSSSHGPSGLSTQSLASLSTRERGNRFIGERTISARVLRTRKAKGKFRSSAAGKMLVLEILWCTLSIKGDDELQKYVLRTGSVENRSESQIFRFECFRKSWVEESERWSSIEEAEAQMAS